MSKLTLRYVQNGDGTFQCKDCNLAPLASRGGIIKHWNVKHNPNFKQIPCNYCGRTFTSRSKYQKHDCSGKSYSIKTKDDTITESLAPPINENVIANVELILQPQSHLQCLTAPLVEIRNATNYTHGREVEGTFVNHETHSPIIIASNIPLHDLHEPQSPILKEHHEEQTLNQNSDCVNEFNPLLKELEEELRLYEEITHSGTVEPIISLNNSLEESSADVPTNILSHDNQIARTDNLVIKGAALQQDVELVGEEKLNCWKQFTKSSKKKTVEDLINRAKLCHNNYSTTMDEFISSVESIGCEAKGYAKLNLIS